MLKRILMVVLLIMGLISCLVVSASAEETDIDTLIEQLPEVSDPMGTEYYFYNQLSDIEKVIYWKIMDATWENPKITICGIDEHSYEDFSRLANRPLTALIADSPEYRMRWERHAEFTYDTDTQKFTVNLWAANTKGSSEYLIQKSLARIQQIVEIIGYEGDIYSRARDLMEYLHLNMEYDPYYPFHTDKILFYNDSAFGCLIYDRAVCAGFSDTVKILCDKLEIPCIVVGNAGHAWNFVRLDDGQWYSIDASRDASGGSDLNFLGQNSYHYFNTAEYHLSDLYIGSEDDFCFPFLANDSYIYPSEYVESFHNSSTEYAEPSPSFTYVVNDDGVSCTITGYQGTQSGDLVIPESVDEYQINAIGEAAFYGCKGFNGNIVVPDSVEIIEPAAFRQCTGITGHLEFSDNVKEIHDFAFMGNKQMTGELTFPNSLMEIGNCVFYQCESISGDIILPEGIELGREIFTDCKSLCGSLYLPDSMTWDGNITNGTGIVAIVVNETNPSYCTFDGVLFSKDMKTLIACPGGKSGALIIPDGVEEIYRLACYDNQNLTGTLSLPDTIKIIGDYAFSNTNFSGDLVIPDSVETIGQSAFSGGGFEGNLILSENIRRIEESSFFGQHFTGTLQIPSAVEYIGHWAFLINQFDRIEFFGCVPEMDEEAFMYVNTVAYYPSDNTTWTETVLKDYGGDLTWYPLCGNQSHSFVTTIVPPTCTDNGYTLYTCSVCDHSYIWDEVFAVGHNYFYEVIEPTCTEQGYIAEKCERCGDSTITGYYDPLGHTWGDSVVTVEPTEESEGEITYTCTVCGTTRTETIPAIDHEHSYEAVVTPPTCTEQGYTTHTCRCGDSYVDTYVDALGHDMGEWTTTTEATCTEDGVERRDCSRCDHSEVQAIPAPGHAYESVITDPTCTAAGYTIHTCTRCGDTFTDSPVDALGHQWDDGVVTVEPTEESEGEMTYTCTVCGVTRTESIPTINHEHSFESVVTPPTCTEHGYTTHICRCGESYRDTFVDALGHDWVDADCETPKTCARCGETEGEALGHTWDDGVVTIEPTEESEGEMTYTCTVCGTTRTETIPAIDHEHSYEAAVTPPTCTERGFTTYTCECGDSYNADYVNALGHDWQDATCTEPETCSRCDTTRGEPMGHNYVEGECTDCGEEDPDWEEPTEPTEPEPSEPEEPTEPEEPVVPDGTSRLAGSNRYETGFAVANQLKANLGIEQFETVIVAYGQNFPDALTGSYLASVKNAPILLTEPSADAQLLTWLRENLIPGGKVYILGGTAVVSQAFEDGAKSFGFDVHRLMGAGRYETNLEILKEAGVNTTDEVLIATGKNYADSLSASATGLPMLLVDKKLTEEQKAFLETTSKNFVILGGEKAVSPEIEAELSEIGTVTRVMGNSRYETSVAIACRYFENPRAAVLAYGEGFPDGLCGGPLALSMGAPLILTSNESYGIADDYIEGITTGVVTGGTSRISDETVREIFDLPGDAPIVKP